MKHRAAATPYILPALLAALALPPVKVDDDDGALRINKESMQVLHTVGRSVFQTARMPAPAADAGTFGTDSIRKTRDVP